MATMAQRIRQDRKNELGGVFRVLIGSHIGQGPEGCECDNCAYGDDATRAKNHRYRARQKSDQPEYDGDIVESEVDLCARFNAGGGSIKYERLHEPTEPIQTRPMQTKKQKDEPLE